MGFTERSRPARDAILTAARGRFTDEGYERTTIRAVAADAGQDPSMVMRYYGSKEGLFAATVDLDLRLPDAESPPDQLGARLALHFIAIWEVEPARGALLVLLRSAATYPAAAQRMRAVFLDQVLAMVRRATGDAEDAAVRAGLITSQVLGTALCRYVLALPPMVAMDAQALAAVLGPQLQHCLTGPLNA